MLQQDLLNTFVEEALENLQSLEDDLFALEKNTTDSMLIDRIFRAMHTIKGGAGLVGLMKICAIAHDLENILENVRQGTEPITPQLVNILLKGADILNKMVNSSTCGEEGFEEEALNLKGLIAVNTLVEATTQLNQPTQISPRTNRYYRLELKLRQDFFETGTDPLMLIYELEDYGRVLASYANTQELATLDKLDPYQLSIKWTVFLESPNPREDIEEVFIFVSDDNHIEVEDITNSFDSWFSNHRQIAQLFFTKGVIAKEDLDWAVEKQMGIGLELKGYQDKGILPNDLEPEPVNQPSTQGNKKQLEINDTIRVESKKLEEILNLIAELLISQSRVKEIVFQIPQLNKHLQVETHNAFGEVDKIIRLLQEQVMHTSMIPIGGTFVRFQRMIRDLAAELGKEVDLALHGKDTKLDKKVIEQISDPLKHLVRNCVDHGLETPEERNKAGKNPCGHISLNAYHQEGSFVIEISDDGRGINEEKVIAKAIERGLIEKGTHLSTSDVLNLIFLPGFSTASQITDVSGRGVGLDVVMNNIRNLRGSVEVSSEKGRGTKFTLRLPLTLAIIDGMVIRVGEERFILPLTSIAEFVKISDKDILRAEGKGLIVHLRNEYVPYMALYQLLELEPECSNPTQGILVILKDQNKKMAVLVDEIIGQDQVVIKSIKDTLEETEGMAGATILGDGKVAVILDVPSLFTLFKKKNNDYKAIS